MRCVLLLACLAFGACAADTGRLGSARSDVLRDVEGYAVASCLVNQAEPYLKDQGDAWASVVLQRTKGDVEVFARIAEEVKRENAKADMAVIRNEAEPGSDKALPVLHCAEMIDRASVRAAIQKAVATIEPSSRQ